MATGANAVPGQTATESTTANVVVGSSITLTGLVPSFSLTGNPGETVSTTVPPVTMTVATNNNEGYAVTVQPRTPTLNPTAPGNTSTIPIGNLRVREAGTTTFSPLIFGTPVQVHTQATPSAELGDTITNNYQITIPFVIPDTYSAVLDYVATTL
ncbi:hypothetical protein [Frankia sp. AiPa1]|uniref:hypothetical protein n=1 Tax=Frankia sp. AiPa1 TaxID=573492 RepID=UPI00202B4971|nr:hypothetical protein [Frankia sp. AiPa1]MCL9758727.1 hypothetical protein [Frankia sp. AiPa1]